MNRDNRIREIFLLLNQQKADASICCAWTKMKKKTQQSGENDWSF